jgi:putative transposase
LKETTMNTVMEDDIKRWTAKRKTALVLDIIQGKTTFPEASRSYDLNPSEVEQWVEEGKRGMENALRAKPLEAKAPDERWATDLCRVWSGRDGWASLALVIDRYSRELLGWHLSRSGRSKTAEAALEQALIARYGCLGRVQRPFLLRSDNGLVFTSRSYTALVKSYGLQQKFITPYSPEQNGMVERVIRALKEQCVHRHRFETLQDASRVIADWIGFYNHQRPHQALNMRTPSQAYALAA